MYTTSDMNGHISSTTLDLNELATDKILNKTTPLDLFVDHKQIWENPTCEGRLIYPEGCVSSFNKSNPTNPQARLHYFGHTQQYAAIIDLIRRNKGSVRQNGTYNFANKAMCKV